MLGDDQGGLDFRVQRGVVELRGLCLGAGLLQRGDNVLPLPHIRRLRLRQTRGGPHDPLRLRAGALLLAPELVAPIASLIDLGLESESPRGEVCRFPLQPCRALSRRRHLRLEVCDGKLQLVHLAPAREQRLRAAGLLALAPAGDGAVGSHEGAVASDE